MSKLVKVKLFRKAINTADIKQRTESGVFCLRYLDVQKTIRFDRNRYQEFCSQMLQELDCLDGLDYTKDSDFQPAFKIVCPEKQTLYIAPEGFSYARYVGIEHPEESEINERRFFKHLESIENSVEEIKCRITAMCHTDYPPQVASKASMAASAARLLLDVLNDTKGVDDDMYSKL